MSHNTISMHKCDQSMSGPLLWYQLRHKILIFCYFVTTSHLNNGLVWSGQCQFLLHFSGDMLPLGGTRHPHTWQLTYTWSVLQCEGNIYITTCRHRHIQLPSLVLVATAWSVLYLWSLELYTCNWERLHS